MPALYYDYPTSQELMEIEQVLMPRLEENRLGLQLMPRVNADASRVQWEQLDNFVGLQQLIVLDAKGDRLAVGKYEPTWRYR